LLAPTETKSEATAQLNLGKFATESEKTYLAVALCHASIWNIVPKLIEQSHTVGQVLFALPSLKVLCFM
jgi:hypothetical protein